MKARRTSAERPAEHGHESAPAEPWGTMERHGGHDAQQTAAAKREVVPRAMAGTSVVPARTQSAEDILAPLDSQQREVAATPLGPMCVLAGAGTGKTRAITHRIAYGVASAAYRADTVLAVTFTNRAAGEMRARLRALGVGGVQARTFHAAALRQLQFFWPRAIGGPPPDLIAQKASLVAEAASRLRLRLDRAAIRDVAAEVEWTKVNMIPEEDYPATALRSGRDTAGLDTLTLSRLMRAYEELKSDRGVIDFEDVLLITVGIFVKRPDIADEVRRRYRVFVVDEYQDVNEVQQRLLSHWLGDRRDVCVVGDPSQTIYSFAGASATHLRTFPTRHRGAVTVRLTTNYRSTPQVVALANQVLSTSPGSVGLRLVAQRPGGPLPSFTVFDDDEHEAAGVARSIAELIGSGVDPAEIAVLFRTNAQSAPLESALARADVSYLVRGGERFFAREEVRKAIVLLRGAARAEHPGRQLPDVTADVLTGMGWTTEPPSGSGATRDRWESLASLVRLAHDLAVLDSAATVRDLVVELDQRMAAQHPPDVRGVTLSSLHAAKGLEWDVVFLVGCSEGLLPISAAGGPGQVEEERRLFYVGITRARREIRLSMAAARTAGSGRGSRRPSRFLDGSTRLLDATSAAHLGSSAGSAGGSPDRRRARRRGTSGPAVCRTCGALLDSAAERKVGRCSACPATYDEAVFNALQGWRRDVASASKVPAYVVFTDATLTAIAERTPRTLAELATISGVGPVKLDKWGLAVLAVLTRPDSGEGSTDSVTRQADVDQDDVPDDIQVPPGR